MGLGRPEQLSANWILLVIAASLIWLTQSCLERGGMQASAIRRSALAAEAGRRRDR